MSHCKRCGEEFRTRIIDGQSTWREYSCRCGRFAEVATDFEAQEEVRRLRSLSACNAGSYRGEIEQEIAKRPEEP